MHPESKPTPDFDALAREYSPFLRRFLRRQIGDAAAAEDLLQETLLRIARGLAGFAGRSSLKTWVFAIASNVVGDYLRAPARRQQIVDVDEAAELDAGAPAVDARMEFDEMNRCVRGVIDSLPADYRAALILHDLEELDCAETAQALGVSLGAAKVRIHRARARLRAALERECGFYHDGDSVLRCAPRR